MTFSTTPLLLGLVFVAVTTLRLVWLQRTAKTSAYVIDHSDRTHRFIAHVLFGVGGGLLLYFAAIAVWPNVESYVGRLDWAISDVTRIASVALMVFAIAWTAYAQASLGTSLRVGIPQGEAPPLRTSGAFAVSRNPIFLGMLLFVVGLSLWSPSAVTIGLLIASYMAIEVQIRGEEAFLETAYGDAYRAYCARVRRWL